MEINWPVLIYLAIGIFVLAGFSSGWWKEAFVTFFLGLLVFLLQNPDSAQALIDGFNQAVAGLWAVLPPSLVDLLAQGMGLPAGTVPQANPSSPTTWLAVLMVGMAIATQIGRLALPSSFSLSLMGRLVGGVLGGVNGLLVVNLIREYLDGRSLPGATTTATVTGVRIVGGSTAPPPAAAITVRAADLPPTTILDSGLPWIVIGIGLFLFVAAVVNSLKIETNAEKMRRITVKKPFGYR
ncbi:MAG: hypothetical protein D6784_15950 [Chloroflexi bacterium]|nr:MAG: hypothetical protein D6784_15950 [Chloroflexota bacterium]